METLHMLEHMNFLCWTTFSTEKLNDCTKLKLYIFHYYAQLFTLLYYYVIVSDDVIPTTILL